MFRNYLKVALRSLRRRYGYTLINVIGLAVGLTCCLLTFLYVTHETGYDRFHEKADRIFRMENDVRLPSGFTESAYTPLPHGPLLDEEIPAIQKVVRFVPGPTGLVLRHEDQRFDEPDFLFADSTIFEVFTFPLAKGSPQEALTKPFSVVLTRETAAKYFGDDDPIGKSLTANGKFTFTVTGVLERIPARSHLQFDGLFSIESAREMKAALFDDLLNLAHATYVLVEPGVDAEMLTQRANDVVGRAYGEVYRESNIGYEMDATPLPDVYLYAHRSALGAQGSLRNLYIFSLIAGLTLVIACINFMNLATARSVERAREVGIRRVVGSRRSQVATQFLCESVLLTLPALLLAIVVALPAIPLFNELAGTSLSWTALLSPPIAAAVLLGTIGVGLLAGSYPAIVLSGIVPAKVLKGRYATSRRGLTLRKGLVVFQFAIAIALIAGTAVIHRQVDYLQRQKLGINAEQMLVIDFHQDADVLTHLEAIKHEMEGIPGVAGATASNAIPGRTGWQALSFAETPDGDKREMLVRTYPVDFDYVSEFDIEVVAGRAFESRLGTDSTEAFLINETARREMGYASPEAAIGKSFQQWGREGRIVGVVEDFHTTSLRSEIDPLSLFIAPKAARFLTLRLSSSDYRETVAAVREIWLRLVPHRPFDYSFLDASFQKLYEDEVRFGSLIGVFSLLAILVACLGLLGLASFTAVQRTREIGIRKVLGATVAQIVVLLSEDLVRLVAIAFLIAAPIVYLAMREWLQEFAYRIDMPWGMFLLAGAAAMMAALLTVSYQSIRTATANPVRALRAE